MTKYEKALLDVIAYAEGTLGLSHNGYDITFGHYVINGWTNDTDIIHMGLDWAQPFGKDISTAAGRYQFKYKTWKGNWIGGDKTKSGQNVPLSKKNQDAAALHQIKIKKKVSDSELVNMGSNIKIFAIVMDKISAEWASLPTHDGGGHYDGQGGKYNNTLLLKIFNLALARY